MSIAASSTTAAVDVTSGTVPDASHMDFGRVSAEANVVCEPQLIYSSIRRRRTRLSVREARTNANNHAASSIAAGSATTLTIFGDASRREALLMLSMQANL